MVGVLPIKTLPQHSHRHTETHAPTHTPAPTLLTTPGSTGASHMCLPSWVLFTPSTSLSGVRTSPFTLSRTFTLSGNAAMSEHKLRKHFCTQLNSWFRFFKHISQFFL
ncbi:hypothetical protein MATL_G00010730 [Megalops atlanticus]|uniref:Uncharacterized protein n=1 Tax=Megalops atlanticus TaxID=7932 RepID=A0A9D3QJK6_MEGAT|nr:hypothetical protein MATL_G00010730 [Megalops atlanticus]